MKKCWQIEGRKLNEKVKFVGETGNEKENYSAKCKSFILFDT